jgi:hypothetical protein
MKYYFQLFKNVKLFSIHRLYNNWWAYNMSFIGPALRILPWDEYWDETFVPSFSHDMADRVNVCWCGNLFGIELAMHKFCLLWKII